MLPWSKLTLCNLKFQNTAETGRTLVEQLVWQAQDTLVKAIPCDKIQVFVKCAQSDRNTLQNALQQGIGTLQGGFGSAVITNITLIAQYVVSNGLE